MLVGVLIGRAFVAASTRGSLTRIAIALGSIGTVIAIAAQLISAFVIAHLGSFGFEAVPGVEPELFTTLLTTPSFGAPMSPLPWAQLVATPHSGSPMDLLRTIGIGLAVVSVLVLIFDVARGNRKPSRVTDIVRSAGAASLTIYTLHVAASGMLFSAVLADAESTIAANGMMPWWAAGPWSFLIQFAGVLVIGAILSFTRRRGPLEALVSGVVKTAVRS
ncbi:hypothetical protein G7066_10005 [Leucobacter coleopterorum]|uniref:DUF418 domain-containing protein n=1 Tax=Leucobacter coleopterorum TaxID=2714933 RepID=A0ABX6K173_9MICO|nr:hypothetical protein [Leucobacter coleopterorum]QIM18839.1 hypothetical protein G7066_10005 [Leucobacter coleopterorum]